MIKLQIIGNLGKDCLVKEVNGRSVINFSVAHADKYKDNQGVQHERTTWVECAYWTDKTTVSQWLTKGRTVYAEGTPEADAYIDRNNNAAATLRMRCFSIQLLGGGTNDHAGQQPAQNTTSQPTVSQDRYVAPNADAIDDLPF